MNPIVADDDRTDSSFLEKLKERAEQEIPALRARIAALMAPNDAFDWMANLFFANVVIDPEKYKESTFEGLSVVVEYGTRELISRPSRGGSSGGRLINGPVIEETIQCIKSLVRWAAMSSMHVPDNAKGEMDALRYSVLGHRLFLRHPVFEHQERNILERLFGTDFDNNLRAELGFTVSEALALCDVFRSLPLERLRERAEMAQVAVVEVHTRGRASDDLKRLRRQFKVLPSKYRTAATAMAWDAVGDTVSLRVEDLAGAAGVTEEAAKRFLDLFSLGFDQKVPNGIDWVAGFAAGYNPLLRQPIVHDGAGNYLCIGPGLLLFAFREVLEEQIKDPDRRDTFYRRRGRFLEDEIGRVLEIGLRPDMIKIGLKYRFEGGVVDTDVLAVVGTVAIVAEGKAKLLSESARRAAPKSLSRDLDEIIRQGGEQAERVRTLVRRDGGLQLVNEDGTETWLDLSQIKRVLPLVVTLEDLGWIAAAIEPLVSAGLVKDDQAALLIGIHDLEIMCDVVEFPAQLVHYLLRRYALNRLRVIAAIDELDYFMHYLMSGLFFDDLSQSQNAPTSVFVSSLTDDLDAYYMHVTGVRAKPASKPRQRMPKHLRRVLQQLNDERAPGWLDASLSLLDMASDGRELFATTCRRLRHMSAMDGTFHDASWLFDDFGITVMSAPTPIAFALRSRLVDYCRAKRFQQDMSAWYGFGVVGDGAGQAYQEFSHVNEPYGSESELVELCRSMGLVLPAATAQPDS